MKTLASDRLTTTSKPAHTPSLRIVSSARREILDGIKLAPTNVAEALDALETVAARLREKGDARAVFEGVDDSFELWLNGEPAGAFGDAATKTTIWLERQTAELAQRLRPGARNTLVLRVVDHAGAGGLWKPAFLTTGPAAASRFLN